MIWIDSSNNERELKDLSTDYLYYIVRIIWNTFCPTSMIKEVDHPCYMKDINNSNRYFWQVYKEAVTLLEDRKDLKAYQREILNKIDQDIFVLERLLFIEEIVERTY